MSSLVKNRSTLFENGILKCLMSVGFSLKYLVFGAQPCFQPLVSSSLCNKDEIVQPLHGFFIKVGILDCLNDF